MGKKRKCVPDSDGEFSTTSCRGCPLDDFLPHALQYVGLRVASESLDFINMCKLLRGLYELESAKGKETLDETDTEEDY